MCIRDRLKKGPLIPRFPCIFQKFLVISSWNCVSETGLLEIVCTLGSKDAYRTTQNKRVEKSIDFLDTIQTVRGWLLRRIVTEHKIMGIRCNLRIKTIIHSVEAHFIGRKERSQVTVFLAENHAHYRLVQERVLLMDFLSVGNLSCHNQLGYPLQNAYEIASCDP